LLKDTTQSGLAPHTEAAQRFEQWLASVGKSVETAKNYRQVIEKSIIQWATYVGMNGARIRTSCAPICLSPEIIKSVS